MLSEEERARLVSEISQRETQVASMRSLVESKTYETNKLQLEVDRHQRQQNNHHHYVAEPHVPEHHEHNGSGDYTSVNVGSFKNLNPVEKIFI